MDICNKNLDCPCTLSLDMVANEIRKYIIKNFQKCFAKIKDIEIKKDIINF